MASCEVCSGRADELLQDFDGAIHDMIEAVSVLAIDTEGIAKISASLDDSALCTDTRAAIHRLVALTHKATTARAQLEHLRRKAGKIG